MRGNKDWIQTYTGRRVYPLDPRPRDFNIYDIAHALSLQCRFTGHVHEFYCVAQHSYLASLLCDPEDALWGLLHDASEAYLSDIARPVKKQMDFYLECEARLTEAIAKKFGLKMPIPESVHKVDNRLLMTERRDLLIPVKGWQKYAEPYEARIEPWDAVKSEEAFLQRFTELRPTCQSRKRVR